MKKVTNYLTPFILLILIFLSNFISKNIFESNYTFSIWFVLSLFCFSMGYFINKTLGWNWGGKVVFAVIITSVIFSILFLTIFRSLFDQQFPLIENIFLNSLRNITLGSMGFFGMAIAEILRLEKVYFNIREKLNLFETRFKESNKEAELVIKEAEFKAKEIVFDAQNELKNINEKRNKLERELKEFIQSERELLKKYEGKQ